MGKYDELGKEVKEETNEQLEAGLKKLNNMGLEEQEKLFPEPADRVKIAHLIEAVKQSTDGTQLKNAWKDFGKAAGATLLKVARKAILG